MSRAVFRLIFFVIPSKWSVFMKKWWRLCSQVATSLQYNFLQWKVIVTIKNIFYRQGCQSELCLYWWLTYSRNTLQRTRGNIPEQMDTRFKREQEKEIHWFGCSPKCWWSIFSRKLHPAISNLCTISTDDQARASGFTALHSLSCTHFWSVFHKHTH